MKSSTVVRWFTGHNCRSKRSLNSKKCWTDESDCLKEIFVSHFTVDSLKLECETLTKVEFLSGLGSHLERCVR